MNLDVIGGPEGQVEARVLATANQSLPCVDLSRAILIGMGQVLYALPFGGLGLVARFSRSRLLFRSLPYYNECL